MTSQVGVGSLEAADLNQANNFYVTLGNQAKTQGNSISVISLPGEECNLDNLGKLADTTGGDVDIVDPLKLTENFRNILSSKLIATNCTVTMILHKGLRFRNEDMDIEQPSAPEMKEGHDNKENNSPKKSAISHNILCKDVGNVYSDSEISFEFEVRPKQELESLKVKFDEQLPFQVQVPQYTLLFVMPRLLLRNWMG